MKYCIRFLFLLQTVSASAAGLIGDSASFFIQGWRFHYAYFWPHSRSIAPIGEAYPWGVQAEFKWQLAGEKTWQQCYCYPQTGFHFTYFNFDKPGILGEGLAAAWFIEPFFTVHRKVNFSLRGSAGIAWLSTPYDSVRNPMNLAYSMHVNGFVLLHLGMNFRITSALAANISVNINHLSNGGIKQPNKGINFPGGTIGLDYSMNSRAFPARQKNGFDKEKKRMRADVSAYFSGKTLDRQEDIYFPVYGSALQVSKQVGKINALDAGLDWTIDFALRRKLENINREGIDFNRIGFLLGHEFLMGRFSLIQQLGIYAYDPSHIDDPVYQRYGLIYKPGKHFFFGINVKAHRHVADFMDIRGGWCF